MPFCVYHLQWQVGLTGVGWCNPSGRYWYPYHVGTRFWYPSLDMAWHPKWHGFESSLWLLSCMQHLCQTGCAFAAWRLLCMSCHGFLNRHMHCCHSPVFLQRFYLPTSGCWHYTREVRTDYDKNQWSFLWKVIYSQRDIWLVENTTEPSIL